ncbi:MAG: metallophosphoesterase [Clostridia bacterium]|nr:metallophosphoesterase [Clostridia bacterium]
MKKLTLILILILSLSLILISCGGNTNDTSSDTQSSVNTDTQTDTNTDTNTDTSTDTSADTDTDTDDVPPVSDRPAINPEYQDEVDALLSSKHKLTYNDDGSFRVLIIADTHMNTNSASGAVNAVSDRIKILVDRVDPNLVIFTGDNTINSSSEEQLRKNIDKLVSYIEEKKIPWCHVYGNHDYENALATKYQQQIYESYEYCISKNTDELSGVGTYVHGVYNKDGSLGSVIYLFDSGTYGPGGYGYITQDRIDWYKATSETLQAYNGGQVVPGMAAFHIPLVENNHAYENRNNTEIVYEWDGQRNEGICSSSYDTNLLETIFERGDIKLIVTGHDHVNDYMFNYKGVKLASSPNISELTYSTPSVQGSRVIDLNESTVGTNIPTYVTYLIERPNPDDYGTLDTNVSVELDGTDSITGSGSGKLNIDIVDGKGADGSDAIKVVRGNGDDFTIVFDMTNKGKLGNNKYLVMYLDFTETELSKGTFGLLDEKGVAAPYTSKYANEGAVFYYLPDGETEWQEIPFGENGYFGVDSIGSQSMNGKKGYFAFAISDMLNDVYGLDENSLITSVYFFGSYKSNLKYIDKPFYIDDIKLVETVE